MAKTTDSVITDEAPSAAKQPTSSLNVERVIQEHAPTMINQLEEEIAGLVVKLQEKEALLVRMKLHQRISQG